MNRPQQPWRRRGGILATIGATVLLVTGCSGDMESLNPVTDKGEDINRLFDLSFILSFIVMGLVFALLVYSLLRFRGPGEPSEREGNTRLEIFWTSVPALLLVVLFIFTLRTMIDVDAGPEDDSDVLNVNVVGNQWWWSFEYPDLGITTANELHLPVGRPIELSLTGKDVIHSFWVPEIGWKFDTIPGKTNTMRFTINEAGTFDGACTEFCGVQHAWMRISVVAEDADTFATWSESRAAPASEPSSQLARDGKATFLSLSCATCHTIQGVNDSNEVGPDLTHLGSRSTLGAGVIENNEANLRAWILDPHAIKPGVLMPAFTTLSDDEIDSLVEYLKGLK
jgi:cytochrome c oxidase subunit 2